MGLIELYKSEDNQNCILCGEELIKLQDGINTICDYCGKQSKIYNECNSNHYICETCINIDKYEFIIEKCLGYKSTDPIKLAIEIMNSPIIKMHGTEHHFIVPAVLLTTVYNYQNKYQNLREKLEIIKERALKETSSYCTYKAGTCGAAFGTGVFLSVLMDRTPYSEDEWTESNHIIADSLKNIANSPGPKCCKRDTYLSILASIEFLKDKFAINLESSEPKCTFSLRNKTCGREECEFFNIANDLV